MRLRNVLLITIVAAGAAHAQRPAQVVMLGTGTPNADPDRSGPSVAVVIDGRAYIVDAGAGVVRRAAAAAARGVPALQAPKLSILFLTHLHSDHTVGVPDLMLSPWTLGRTEPLRVFGPPGTKVFIDKLADAYSVDVENRTTGLEPANKTGWRAIASDVAPGIVYHDSSVTVRAFAVPHANWAPGHALGYRFETPGRTIVISGDTRASDSVVKACNACDVLVHEAILESNIQRRTADWQRYHRSSHTTAIELGELAARARPKLLVLYHLIPPKATDDEFLREVRQHYSGAVVVARDLGIY